MKGPAEKNFEGIYANPRFMHAAGMIVGCIVQVQVKNGATFEGVLRTFSHKADFVLEMPRKIDSKKSNNATSNTVTSLANSEEVTEKMIFRFDDVVTLNAQNVDPDYATRDSFTDTAISKFNGQVVEKELEPWDGGSISADSLPDLGGGDEEANGWDANDMFRTNEEKYGVKSSFDSNLPGYTIPLNKQNTEEYRQQEARASKLASEIESASHHKSRAALENGDEEDRYSAVIRPADNSNNNSNNTNNNNNNNNFRYVSHRNRKPVTRSVRNSAPPPHHANRNSHQHPSLFRVSSPASAVTNSQGNYKMVSPMSATSCVSALSTRPTPDSTPTSRQSQVQQNQLPLQPPAATQYPSSVPVTNTSSCVTPLVPHSNTPLTPTVPQGDENPKINGEAEKTEIKFTPKPPRSLNLQSVANKEMREVTNQQGNNKTSDRRKDADKKQLGQKAREDKTEDLKRFHSKFKLSEDPKDAHDTKDMPKSDVQTPSSTPSSMPSSKPHKDKSKEEERKIESIPENRGSPDNHKSSTLNPNAKEFVFNPNAKSFTPRAGMPMQNVVPPPVQPPPRLHTQSPIMAMPQHHIIPGMPQTVFNVAPHYVVSATPVSLPMAPPFTPAASVTQAPRFRKAHATIDGWGKQAMPIMHRQDLSQPVHVQAATGQPILAQPTLSAPQFAIQYAPSPGMLHPPGPPQQLAYAQMYSLMPRVLTPQPVGMVPTSAAYGENPQIPTHVYMHPGTPSLQHPMASNSGQHSAPSTPQSQTPNLHPAPSPVHQPPPSGSHGQPPTPTGHPSNAPTPQPVMYAHGHMTTQHPLHANHSSSNQGHPFAASYAGTPQPIVILPQQPHAPHPTFAAAASSLPNHHLHGQTPGSHVGTPTHVLPHAQMAMIPTSAAMVHTPTAAISTGHYIPHSQVFLLDVFQRAQRPVLEENPPYFFPTDEKITTLHVNHV